ncbi:hypothetical protein [Leeuwenhoekiella parthenopeia]|uniref:DUF5673 domain-containing protein n=1 Tax=Leeuwenhoekiella parthenopeia TaxID=2890320 RepID=A0ABS8GQB5_9FLAO|nr:hypothetical protein [Leeuwenhoekiella parthenopeia]MCC4211885.1 hypothetical protein [Leeuwenhoekiella parthenopeia]
MIQFRKLHSVINFLVALFTLVIFISISFLLAIGIGEAISFLLANFQYFILLFLGLIILALNLKFYFSFKDLSLKPKENFIDFQSKNIITLVLIGLFILVYFFIEWDIRSEIPFSNISLGYFFSFWITTYFAWKVWIINSVYNTIPNLIKKFGIKADENLSEIQNNYPLKEFKIIIYKKERWYIPLNMNFNSNIESRAYDYLLNYNSKNALGVTY